MSPGLTSNSSCTSVADAGLSADGFGVVDFATGDAVLLAAEAWLFGVYIFKRTFKLA